MAITDRISKQELEELYLIQNLSDEKIGKIYNVAGSTIFAARKKYNIPTLEQYQKHHKQELSLKEKEFLIGTLLGDAHVRLRKNKKAYPQFMFEQTTKHKEYFLWIKAQIIDWLYNPHLGLSDYFGTHKKNGKEYSSYSLRTICHPVFLEIYNNCYQNKIKIINTQFLEQYFSAYSLAVWFMDDGTISNNRNNVICTQSFSYTEHQALSKMLLDKFDLKANIWKNTNKYCLAFPKKESIKLKSIIGSYVIPEMQYKLNII